MNKVLCLDLETTGLNPWKDKITCVGVYNSEIKRVYRDLDKLRDALLVGDLSEYTLVGQNFRFDLKFLHTHNIPLPIARWSDDTQIMAHVHTSKVTEQYLEWYERERVVRNKALKNGHKHRQTRGNSLKVLAPFWLGIPPFWEDPSNHNKDDYVLKDAEYTFRLYEVFTEKLKAKDEYWFYQERMMPWARMLVNAELTGITLDLEAVNKMQQEYAERDVQLKQELDKLWEVPRAQWLWNQKLELSKDYTNKAEVALSKIKELTKEKHDATMLRYKALYDKAVSKLEEFNYASPSQMSWLLKDYFKLDITDDIKDEDSTGKAVLQKLSKSRPDISKFLDYRENSKVLNSYFPSYLDMQIDGIIHPEFNITGTNTGRLSASNPNVQQIPSELYHLFKARPGKTFVMYDMAAIEAKIIAYYSNDPNLYKIIKSGSSIHDYNVAEVFFKELGVTPDRVKKEFGVQRNCTKKLGFSLFYGAGPMRIEYIFTQDGFIEEAKKSKQLFNRFKAYYKEAFTFHDYCTDLFKSGESLPNLFGRPVRIQNPADAYMKGMNYLVQSSASDMNLYCCNNVITEAAKVGITTTPLLFVHDFTLFEVAEEHAKELDLIVQREYTRINLENKLGKIDLAIEGGIGTVWQK